MPKNTRFLWGLLVLMVLILGLSSQVTAQSTTGTILGMIMDEQKAVMPGVSVTVRNAETNASRSTVTDSEGRFRFGNLPVGTYELTVEAQGFAKYVRTGIVLVLNQDAVVEVMMKPAALQETVTVTENAALLNTTNAEVGVRFDTRRISELPLAANRDVFNIFLSAAGVSQLGSGQTDFASGINFSVNGARLRSNNFMIDGQDSNDPSVAGRQQPINNPDIVQEVRLITNQFAAEYGRSSGSVVNIITKNGTNSFHGSAFEFHNDDNLNSRSNLDKNAFAFAPARKENQFGGTIGGPIWKDHTWFFASYQRWTNRQLGSGFTLNGAPTDQGRSVLQAAAGNRPQVAALLKYLPVAQTAIGKSATFVLGAQTYVVPLGSLTGSAPSVFNNHQWSARIDHDISPKHRLSGRYMFNNSFSSGSGQVTPSGLTTINPSRTQAMNLSLSSVLNNRMVNELRVTWQRLGTVTNAEDSSSEAIPSIEISELGLTGFNAATSRTAIGLAVNLPQFRYNNTYQLADNFSYTRGNHAMKFGGDIRRVQVKSFFFPTIRGRLAYSTLQKFVDDSADLAATINKPLPGGQELQYYNWHDIFFFWQDEWKVKPNFTLTYGMRYETPGNSVASLIPMNDQIVAAAGGDPAYKLSPVPQRDTNNFQPRFGFNWNPHTAADGFIGRLTGGDRLVVRGGYVRTNDYQFININLNIASAFPFVAAITLPSTNSFASIATAQVSGLNPLQLTRTIVGGDFRSPYADQFSFEVQRELSQNLVMRVAWVATKGTALYQSIDGNPRVPSLVAFNSKNPPPRVDPSRGVIRLRDNSSSSIYHSMQVSLDKRFSRGFSAALHYTWSAFIDDASEIFNPSSGEVAVSQDSFNRRADRARSSYDRPHRFTGNFVYEFPWHRNQEGVLGHLLGGWQVNSLFTFQSGAPFTVLNGADPTGALNGIDGLIGNAIRPNLNTTQPLSSMTVENILRAGGASLFSRLPSSGVRVGNVGRNSLRADGIGNVDFGIFKNTRIHENHQIQLRAELYNSTNTRNFGIPEGRVNSTNFLNQWGTDGGNRRIVLGIRYTF